MWKLTVPVPQQNIPHCVVSDGQVEIVAAAAAATKENRIKSSGQSSIRLVTLILTIDI